MRAEQLLTTTSSKENIMTVTAPAVTVGTVINTPQAFFSLPAGSVLVNPEDNYIYHVVKDRGQLYAAEYAAFSPEPTYTFFPSSSTALPNNVNLTVIHVAR
jgi:hypothetical protein